MSTPVAYPIGTPGVPWTTAEVQQWRARQKRQRSYAHDVVAALKALSRQWQVDTYGEVVYGAERFELYCARSFYWDTVLPTVLVTGGVHGYETSGVHGALRFLQTQAVRHIERSRPTDAVNLLVVPCVSPWAYERIQRWNFDAIDPNRQFREGTEVQECAALMRLVEGVKSGFAAHIDLHETTDTDETEFGPARAARDGKDFEPHGIPDGFYAVDDSANPQPAFQAAIIEAVARVTHIAAADAQGEIIGSPVMAHGVIHYDFKGLGLCAGITGARWTCTTEVYPDSASASPEQCIEAQMAAVDAALEFVREKINAPRRSLQFRAITQADIPSLFEVRIRTRENTYTLSELAAIGITPTSVAQWLESSTRGWLCEADGRTVGFCMVDRDQAELLVIAVLPDFEGQGVGAGVMRPALNWLRECGCASAWLTTDLDPALRAYGFYRHHGWQDWKTEERLRWMRIELTPH